MSLLWVDVKYFIVVDVTVRAKNSVPILAATYLPLAGVVERFTCYAADIIAARPRVDLESAVLSTLGFAAVFDSTSLTIVAQPLPPAGDRPPINV